MSTVTLDTIDAVRLDSEEISDELKIWLQNLVDILNYNFAQIQAAL